MGGTLEETTISAFMDAITNAYGSDIWQGITGREAFYSTDFASKIAQVDGVGVMYNNAGEVMYYTYNQQIVGSGVTIGNVVDSNVGNVVVKSKVGIPANTTTGAGNVVTANSGMKTASATTATTIVKDVAVGVMAVSAGLRLGSTIDSLLYNANPDFWDENGMKELDPQTWDSICSTQTGKSLFNMVFGINKTANVTQAYIDQYALAYTAKYLEHMGVYNVETIIPDDPTIDELFTAQQLSCINFPIKPMSEFYFVDKFNQTWQSLTVRDGLDYYLVKNSEDPTNFNYRVVAVSTTNLPAYFKINNSTIQINWQAWTVQGESGYWQTSQIGTLSFDYALAGVSAVAKPNTNFESVLAYYTFKGDRVTTGGVDGIGQQDGATLPDGMTDDMTIAQILAYLMATYPSLWDDAIYNDVVQPDGSTKRITYVPVPIPEQLNVDTTTGKEKPTGGDESNQANPAVNPVTSPDDLIDTLIDIITGGDEDDGDDGNDDYSDTGEGNTPPIVVPTGSASALYSIYNPSQSELNSFGAWLWSSNFVDQLLKIFNDPMQAIIGLHKVFATPSVSGSGSIKVGYLDSGVSANLVSDQYTEVDCGTVNLYEYFGNALDYTNTDIYIYLPFIGITPLNVSDVMRSSINVKYKVDVVTGACLVSVNVQRDNAGGQLYTYGGNCAVQYPLSSGSYMGIVTGLLGVAGSIAGTIASGGALLPLALGIGASALNGAKTQVQHSGSISGSAGAMGIKKPYLIIRRPQTKIAEQFDVFNGVSNNKTVTLTSCSGYTRVKYCHLENIPATSEELTLINNLLESGVII